MGRPWSQEAYLKAYWFAAQAHNCQKYRGTDLPYDMHCSFVAMEIVEALAAESGLDSDLTVQCALLHDTLEDTSTQYEELVDAFGLAVANGVRALTKDKHIGTDQNNAWLFDVSSKYNLELFDLYDDFSECLMTVDGACQSEGENVKSPITNLIDFFNALSKKKSINPVIIAKISKDEGMAKGKNITADIAEFFETMLPSYRALEDIFTE